MKKSSNQEKHGKQEGEDPEKKNHPKKPPLKSYIKYSAIAFEMLVIIGLGTWLGTWLDEKYQTQTPWFTLGLALVSTFVALYVALRDHIGNK